MKKRGLPRKHPWRGVRGNAPRPTAFLTRQRRVGFLQLIIELYMLFHLENLIYMQMVQEIIKIEQYSPL